MLRKWRLDTLNWIRLLSLSALLAPASVASGCGTTSSNETGDAGPSEHDAGTCAPVTPVCVTCCGAQVAATCIEGTWECAACTGTCPLGEAGDDAGTDAPYGWDGGSVVVLYGGEDGQMDEYDDTWTFDGTRWTEQFSANAPLQQGFAPAMATLGTNQVALFGGDFSTATWTFDGTNWTQIDVDGGAPPGREQHAIASWGTGGLFLFGGWAGVSGAYAGVIGDSWIFSGTDWTPFGPTWTFDASANDWYPGGADSGTDAGAPSPSGRVSYQLATLNGRAVLFGGMDNNDNLLGDTWTFDGTAWTLLDAGDGGAVTPLARAYGTMVTFGDKLVLFGGQVASTQGIANDTWTFDGSTWSQVDTGASASDLPPARYAHAMATLGNRIILFGGTAGGDPIDGLATYGDTWSFDGATWTQLDPAVSPAGRSFHAMATLP
jgi:hypothetical protein